MAKGIRWIGGRQYLLHGRASSKDRAKQSAQDLRNDGYIVRVVKLWEFDYMIYSHGPIEKPAKDQAK